MTNPCGKLKSLKETNRRRQVLPQNCHALLPSLSCWSRPQWNIWTSQITPQLDVCESKWNIWTLMIAEISSLLLTHQDWWWLTYFANPICQFHISLYPLMIRGTQWWWRIWWGWWKERKNKVKEDFTFLGAGATAAPLRRKGSEEIQSFSQLSNGSDLSVNPKCLTTFLDFPFFCFVSKEKILTGQQHIKTWSANGPDWRLIYVNLCKSEQKRIPRVSCVKTKPSQGIRESKTSSPKFLKSNSRIGRA